MAVVDLVAELAEAPERPPGHLQRSDRGDRHQPAEADPGDLGEGVGGGGDLARGEPAPLPRQVDLEQRVQSPTSAIGTSREPPRRPLPRDRLHHVGMIGHRGRGPGLQRPDVVPRDVRVAVGHNYVQELRAARDALADADVTWHFIGTLQTGTATAVADHADVVETVAGERAARRLAGRADRAGRVLDALLEVDLTGERSGLAPGEVAAAADTLAQIPGIRLRGLMTIAPIGPLELARESFRRLRELRDELRDRHPDVLDLSMGMSLDYEVAVQEGATMVRIGSGLFGPRPT